MCGPEASRTGLHPGHRRPQGRLGIRVLKDWDLGGLWALGPANGAVER